MLTYDENMHKLYQSLSKRGCFEYKILNYDGCWRQLFFKTMVSFCDGFVVSVCNDALRFLKHVTKYVNDVVQWKIIPKQIPNNNREDGTSHKFLENKAMKCI